MIVNNQKQIEKSHPTERRLLSWQKKLKESFPEPESIFEQVVKKFNELEEYLDENDIITSIQIHGGDQVWITIILESDNEYKKEFKFTATIENIKVSLSATIYEDNCKVAESETSSVIVHENDDYDFICEKFTELFTSISSWE